MVTRINEIARSEKSRPTEVLLSNISIKEIPSEKARVIKKNKTRNPPRIFDLFNFVIYIF
jgi:hypothetical protein